MLNDMCSQSFVYMSLPSWKILSALCVNRGKFTLVRTSSSVSSWGLPPGPPQSTLDPTSLPHPQLQPPPPKNCRQETAIFIHHFIFYIIYSASLLPLIFQSNKLPQNNSGFIERPVHNNKMPQEFDAWDFICSIRPVIPVTVCTHRIIGEFSF